MHSGDLSHMLQHMQTRYLKKCGSVILCQLKQNLTPLGKILTYINLGKTGPCHQAVCIEILFMLYITQ